MHKAQEQVREFHNAAGLESHDRPGLMSEKLLSLSIRLIDEEFDEFIAAHNDGDILGAIDGLADLLYVVYGACLRLGVDIEPFFDEVQRSNMTKVGGTTNEYGKLVKPDTYTPADIAGIYERMYVNADEE